MSAPFSLSSSYVLLYSRLSFPLAPKHERPFPRGGSSWIKDRGRQAGLERTNGPWRPGAICWRAFAPPSIPHPSGHACIHCSFPGSAHATSTSPTTSTTITTVTIIIMSSWRSPETPTSLLDVRPALGKPSAEVARRRHPSFSVQTSPCLRRDH